LDFGVVTLFVTYPLGTPRQRLARTLKIPNEFSFSAVSNQPRFGIQPEGCTAMLCDAR